MRRVEPRAISPAASRLRQSDIRLIGQAISLRGLAPIRLDIGEPDFPTPSVVLEHASAAIAEPAGYTPAAGTDEFRLAAAEYVRSRCDADVSPGRVVIGAGATGSLMSAFLVLCRPGDEVLVPVPAFPCYRTQIGLVGAVAVGYPLDPAAGWEPDLVQLERVITTRTRAIVLNTPGNPTGAVFSETTMAALAALAERTGVWIVSDEVYADLAFRGRHVSALDPVMHFGRDRTIAVFSLSKSFAMTGWRVGFSVVPPSIVDAITAVNSQLFASPNAMAQRAGASALTIGSNHLPSVRRTLAERANRAGHLLHARGIDHTAPSGAFYLTVRLPQGTDSFAFADRLLDRGAAVVPGTAFVESGSPFLRISLTRPIDEIERGLTMIADALEPGGMAQYAWPSIQ